MTDITQLASQVNKVIKQNLKEKEKDNKKATETVEEFIRMKIKTALEYWDTKQTAYILVIIFERQDKGSDKLILFGQKIYGDEIKRVDFEISEEIEAEIRILEFHLSQIINRLKSELSPLRLGYMYNPQVFFQPRQRIHQINIEHN